MRKLSEVSSTRLSLSHFPYLFRVYPFPCQFRVYPGKHVHTITNTVCQQQPRIIPTFSTLLSLRTFYHSLMSSTSTSTSNFQSIFDAALSDYSKQTGIDLATHTLAQDLQNFHSPDVFLDLLQDRAKQFQAYRDGNRKLINCLKPVVQVLHTLSGILAEATASVGLPGHLSDHLIYASGFRSLSNLQKQLSLVSMFSSPCVSTFASSTTSLSHLSTSGRNRHQCQLRCVD